MVEKPHTIGAVSTFEELCRALEAINEAVPTGFSAEIIGGNIVMSPWSRGYYLDIMESLSEQLKPHAPEGHRVSQAPCLFVFPGQSRAYGPDLHVADADATRVRGIRLPGEALSLVTELTSESTADFDRDDKVKVYGVAGVPVYVLVDMLQGDVTVYHDPTPDRGYRMHTQVKFGETVHIPAPFDFELDTAGWEA
ncbi:Uma2 family endonuclease [Streptomyces sp. SAJ15]|uniref:Uma2 family endonuclease n=1 Tax=Streptomyces sp. SAJ15 TaxID=2011095 RepID=UPI0028CB4F61|nr:Uma2 family endonuclease [Streptomyces sp. SAJ15]